MYQKKKKWWAYKKNDSLVQYAENLLNNGNLTQFCLPQLAPSNNKVMRRMQKEKKREKIIRSLKRGGKKNFIFLKTYLLTRAGNLLDEAG